MLLNKSYFQAIAICVLALIQIPEVFSIAGGVDGDQTKLQYVVKVTVNDVYACGGALVSNRHVVTVYTCVLGVDKARVKVEGGTIDSTVTPANLLAVAEIYRSPHFNQFTRYMDIAVLKLAAAVTNPNMVPIRLRNGGWDAQTSIIMSAWGLRAQGEPATVLQTATIAGISNSECETMFGGFRLPASMWCGGTGNQGDIGALATVDGELAGILSCPGAPAGLTSMSGTRNFINNSMKM